MRKLNLIVACAAALALALALAGCGGNQASSSSSVSASASSASQQGQATVLINTDGLGIISWAYEGEEPEFDDNAPYQSAVVNDAYGQTITLEAREGKDYEGFRFAKWTKDGATYSTDNRIEVLVDGDAEYVAVFEPADGGVYVDYGSSEIYTQEDIDAAIDVIMAEFGQWTGATMKRIVLADDDLCLADLAYCNSLREEGTPEFTQAIVFMTDFHSPSAEQAQGTAWNPDTDYDGYTWHLARTDGGAWQLLTWGYA